MTLIDKVSHPSMLQKSMHQSNAGTKQTDIAILGTNWAREFRSRSFAR
jgi:hypothetical protein